MHPWVTFLKESEDEDFELSKFILQAEFDGRLKSSEGFLSATGDLVILTAAAGKDLYLVSAIAVFFNESANSTSFGDRVESKANGVIKETGMYSFGQASSGFGGVTSMVYEFKNLFHKVAPTKILKLEVINIAVNTGIEGFIEAIEVPTGENPVTYTGP